MKTNNNGYQLFVNGKPITEAPLDPQKIEFKNNLKFIEGQIFEHINMKGQLKFIDADIKGQIEMKLYRVIGNKLYFRSENGQKIILEVDDYKKYKDDLKSGYKHGSLINFEFV